MKRIKFIHKITRLCCLVFILFIGINAQAQTCDFSLNNTGSTGGDTEYYLVLDAAGNIAQVLPGPGPVNLTGVATGTMAEVLHLVYDSANPPANVPPVVGADPALITGCTNDFLNGGLLLECLCEEDQIDATYTPGGGDMLMYYLVDPATGAILDSNTTGDFGTDELVGDYFIYALAYDSTNPPTTLPSANLSEFSADGCYNPDFLTNPCCAQKISCCDLEAVLDLAATTCDGPNGNLIFEIDVTMASGTVTGDNGATFMDNGGGSWTGMVTVTPGTMVTILVYDDVLDCDQEVIIDATFITCDDNGDAVCTLEGTLSTDVNDYVCNADGTITGVIDVTGAEGMNVAIDGMAVGGGDGTYPVTLPGPMGTVVLTDPDGFLNGSCQYDLMYDLSTLLPNTPPTISPNDTITLCPGVPIDPVTASGSPGTTFNWYQDAGLVVPVDPSEVSGASNEIYMPTTVVGTLTVYVVEANAGGCESPATQVTYIRETCAADGGRFDDE